MCDHELTLDGVFTDPDDRREPFQPGRLKNDLRRLFSEHGVDVTVGQRTDGNLFLQSNDLRVITIGDCSS